MKAINNKRYECYETINLSFIGSEVYNPFIDVKFYAIIHGDDFERKVYGFYNGQNEYVIRTSLKGLGDYQYKTYSNMDKLNNHEGSISIVANTDEDKHGAVVLNEESPRRLYYEDGEHYNLTAFECDWLFALSYNDKTDMTKTKQLAKVIADNAFNQVVMNVYAFSIDWEHFVWLRDPKIEEKHDYSALLDIYPFLGTNEEPDYSRLNIEFFKHLDRVVEILNEHHLVAHLMIYVWNKMVQWPSLNSEHDNMFFDYVVKRYQGYSNVLWDVSKEALSYKHCDKDYIVSRVKRLRELDSHQRLVTVHDYKFCEEFPDLLDIISTQTWVLDIHNEMKKVVEKHPDKVVFNIEHGGYERSPYEIFPGNYDDPKVCLRRNYEIAFAGVYSCYYWQALAWSVMIMPWETKEPPMLAYYKHMIEFFDDYDFEHLMTDHELGKGGLFMIDEVNQRMLAYIPKENYGIYTHGHQLFNNVNCTYKYFNTITGEYSESYSFKYWGHNKFQSPYNEDTILVIEQI